MYYYILVTFNMVVSHKNIKLSVHTDFCKVLFNHFLMCFSCVCKNNIKVHRYIG